METKEIHRGRLIDHLHLVAVDFAATSKFYRAVLAALEIPVGGEGPTFLWADELFVSSLDSTAAAGKATGRTHFAFHARDESAVKRFHEAALAAGGKDNGAPGPRKYHPGYFAAFVIDPDGNNVEAVYHGPAKTKSAEEIVITF